ncbi:MAG: quinolinate synthase NadA [Victivallales bacterium]|nr:quinolinate synthase NadA [Victivallales bacterium]
MVLYDDKEMIARIDRLRKSRHAVILTHNYQLGEVQDIADFTGDSLELSMIAAKNSAEVIVFCGVRFMAETAAMLAPEKTVLLPVATAGCLMADMADGEALRQLKAQHPGAVTVCYVNSTAAVKAECDLCVTSANAFELVRNIPADREIIFVPDRNLGGNIIRATGRPMIMWDGFCPTHMRITPAMVQARRREFPAAKIIAHPEVRPEVAELCDEVMSTGGMCRYVKSAPCRELIIATESGIIHRLRKENPDLVYIPLSEQIVCPDMKMTRLGDVLRALETMQPRITVPEPLRERAVLPIRRMLEQSARFAPAQ